MPPGEIGRPGFAAPVREPRPARSHGYFEATRSEDALTVYRRLIHDARLCNGARCLWHYLRDRADKSGKCWPKQRTIAREMRCKTHSLPGWTSQLVSAGYLAVSEAGQNHHHVYQILFGDGKGALPEWATRGKVSCSPKGKGVLPPEAIPRVAQTGDVSNPKEVITMKAYSTKAGKLSTPQKELADRIEVALGVEWTNDAGKWIGRIKAAPGKCERVIAEVESAAREGRIKTTPAPFAEDTWKRFAE